MSKYLTIHSITALEAKQYSIVRANIDNTPEKKNLAAEIYPPELYYIEEHSIKYEVKPVLTNY